MARMIACAACRQTLALPDGVAAGQQIQCPACQRLMVVPGAAKPVVLPAKPVDVNATRVSQSRRTDAMSKPLTAPTARPQRPASTPTPPPPQVVDDDEPVADKPRKKKKKGSSSKNQSSGISGGMKLAIAGMLLFAGTLITLLAVFVPWGKMFSSASEATIVDVYTAVNSMGYNNVGVRVLNSDTAALCIPGPRQIMITRPNPNGKYLLLRLKVPYADVDKFFAGSKSRIYLMSENVQVEYNGVTKNALLIQDDNVETGSFQLSYQPPNQEGVKVRLRDYIGPKEEGNSRNWTHPGTLKEYQDTLAFEDPNGMQVKIDIGSERQDGGGGNIFEHLTGKKILGNQQGLTGDVGGYVHVSWNLGSAGFVVYNDLEQPNEIGTNWNVNAIVELPPGAKNEVNLKVVGKTRKLKIK